MKKNSQLTKIGRSFLRLLTIGAVISLSACSLSYDFVEGDEFGIGYSKLEKRAYIANINYTLGSSLEITLPSDYKGLVIRELGGYFGRGAPTPFDILFTNVRDVYPDYTECYGTSEEYLYDEDLTWWDEREVQDFNFEITLPRYLEKVTYVVADITVLTKTIEDDKTFALIFRPTFYFDIDENNPFFYTKDGKLYNKKTDEIYDCFTYRS